MDSRLKATETDKQQPLKQLPVEIINNAKPLDIAKANPQSVIVDETAGIIYFKGVKKTVKVTGSIV